MAGCEKYIVEYFHKKTRVCGCMEKLWQECDSHNAGDMGNVFRRVECKDNTDILKGMKHSPAELKAFNDICEMAECYLPKA